MEIIEKARRLFDEGNYAEAENLVRTYLDNSASRGDEYEARSEAFELLGNIADDLGQIKMAVEHYRMAVSENPKSANAHLMYGYALTRDADVKPEEVVKHMAGAKHFVIALKLDPSTTEKLEKMLEPLNEPQFLRERIRKMREEEGTKENE